MLPFLWSCLVEDAPTLLRKLSSLVSFVYITFSNESCSRSSHGQENFNMDTAIQSPYIVENKVSFVLFVPKHQLLQWKCVSNVIISLLVFQGSNWPFLPYLPQVFPEQTHGPANVQRGTDNQHLGSGFKYSLFSCYLGKWFDLFDAHNFFTSWWAQPPPGGMCFLLPQNSTEKNISSISVAFFSREFCH